MLTIGIVEDDQHIADLLEFFLRQEGHSIAFKAENSQLGRQQIESAQPDLLFLDISLESEKAGLELAAWLRKETNIPFIFVTSHADKTTLQAAKSLLPNGYLVKPFKKEDIVATIAVGLTSQSDDQFSAKENLTLPEGEVFLPDCLFIRDRKLFLKILYTELKWLQADGNYTYIFTEKGKYSVRCGLKEVEEKLPKDRFLRIHKSYIVNVKAITAINSNHVLLGQEKVPISRSMQTWILSKLNLLSSEG